MIPITRKELYLNKIVGNDDYSVPEKPITTEEFFFAEILGEAVQAPEPLNRYQIYLAKIAGRNISVPKPLTRLELFLARAAGMEIETPIPITREEMLWDTYIPIKTIEGIPPLTFKAKKAGTLKNYRIYGQTVDDESVGDRTGNLFDEINGVVTDIYIMFNGTTSIGVNGDRFIYNKINVLPNITYTFSWQQMILGTDNNTPYIRVSSYDANNNFLARDLIQVDVYPNKTCSITNRNNAAFWDIRIDDASSTRGQHLEGIMLNTGSTPLPYEPYGYKVPVTVSNGTDAQTIPIYLSEQIRKVGDEAEYIDFGEQKQYFTDGTSADVLLPALPTISGTNTLTVGTEVQPSNVYIKYEGAR